MGDPVSAFGDFIVAHKAWAAPAFGLLAFGESLAVAGVFIPATPILFLMGALLGGGELEPVPVLAWAIAGAVGGYWASWAVGRRLGPAVYRVRALRGHRRGVARARLFFRRWGGPALVVGRYVLGPFQSMLPLVAGVAAMGPRRFHGWNVASGVVWVFVCLAPGYLAASGLWALGADARLERRLVAGLGMVSVGGIVAALGAAAWRLRRGPAAPRDGL